MDVGGPLKREKGMDTVAFDCEANTDEALRYVTDLMLDRPYSQIMNYDFCPKGRNESSCSVTMQSVVSFQKCSEICLIRWFYCPRSLSRHRLDRVLLGWTKMSCQ